MPSSTTIRILEKDNNRRGDLFGRLMADLFVALGYEQPRLNVHKSGRELDLSADHRLEKRRAIAECKATAERIGGGDVNKFVGAIDVEFKQRYPVTGYFISLAGFTETATEQEKGRKRTPIILLDAAQAVGEMIKGRSLVSFERAAEAAGRLCAPHDALALDDDTELLAHERGWVWAVYYTQGKARTHFALIHADGTPLARAIADELVAADQTCGGTLHALACLNPAPAPASNDAQATQDALAAYRRYLTEECGYIHLDGMPADGDVGSRRLRLEHLFVPLHLDLHEVIEAVEMGEESNGFPLALTEQQKRLPIGVTLNDHPRLALLASPGGGKSTLLKRLAVAYADPAQLDKVADELPVRDWLPLFFRCRELRELARGSFAELIGALSAREPVRQHAGAFRAAVDRALLEGRVILLVDGLDEISDPGDRAAFVCMLRTAIQASPGTSLVITSREAGFRHVAAHLAPICTLATLSPFDADDISRLTVAWHREVVSDSEKVRTDAEQLAQTIYRNDRIRQLAVNPLLLTTLLLVKRWVGSLPTRRAVLYGKAVEVLLMTWNTEGHAPIPEEEALPQLCYVASAMMLAGVQKISRPRLAKLLQSARDALPTELGFVQDTVKEFIHRVEDRSSLLMMSGWDVEDGRLVEFFEFRHLTFQEFLTARAMVEGWHPDRNDTDYLAKVLEPHFEQEEWREVIPLAASLGGKETEELLQRLLVRLAKTEADIGDRVNSHLLMRVLGQCLADEVQAKPESIRAAIKALLWSDSEWREESFAPVLAKGRYGALLREESFKALSVRGSDSWRAGRVLQQTVWWQFIETDSIEEYQRLSQQFLQMLNSPELTARCEAAHGCVMLFKQLKDDPRFDELSESFSPIGKVIVQLLYSDSLVELQAAIWVIYQLGFTARWLPPANPDVIGRLFSLWQHHEEQAIRLVAVEALKVQQLLPRLGETPCSTIQPEEFALFIRNYDKLLKSDETPAALAIAYYLRTPWDDFELAVRVHNYLNGEGKLYPYTIKTMEKMLAFLGETP
ncbi:MAG: NACHT domain-containing protein [Acidobacteria bacterium]|nr:NACHT domain-containing protein [Acidobacteriota bacterium]